MKSAAMVQSVEHHPLNFGAAYSVIESDKGKVFYAQEHPSG